MTGRRRSTVVFALLGAGLAALGLELAHAALSQPAGRARMAASAALVRGAGLTDLALFTEARYARHPSLADLHTPFQDGPASFEHFPAGTFAPRPVGFGQGALGFDADEVRR